MPYKNKICGVYKIQNIINNKIYIGQSKNIYQRWCEHRSCLNKGTHKNQHLQSAWNKYGEENFEFTILETCSLEQIDELEIFYINKYNTRNQEYGYNLVSGGNKNKTLSEETILKIKKSREGYKPTKETREKISKSQTGRKLSQEWKDNISKHHKEAIKSGKMHVKYQNLIDANINKQRTIDAYNKYGELIGTYNGIQEASRILGVPATNICKVLKNKHSHCNKIYFCDHNTCVEKEYIIHRISKRPIYLLDGDKKILFCSINEASDKLNLSFHCIKNVCDGLSNNAKGYKFCYA